MDPFREPISCFNPACVRSHLTRLIMPRRADLASPTIQPLFFLLDGVKADPIRQLTYRTAFLLPRAQGSTANATVPIQLAPESLQLSARADSSRSSWSGFHCSACGRLSCRRYWDRLECSNCGVQVGAMPTLQPAPLTMTSTATRSHVAPASLEGITRSELNDPE